MFRWISEFKRAASVDKLNPTRRRGNIVGHLYPGSARLIVNVSGIETAVRSKPQMFITHPSRFEPQKTRKAKKRKENEREREREKKEKTGFRPSDCAQR